MIKRICGISIITAVMVMVCSCSTDSKPEKVAEKFLLALSKCDPESAKKYCTEETGQIIEFMTQLIGDDAKANAQESKPKIKAEAAKVSADGNSATVKVAIKNGFNFSSYDIEAEFEEELQLVKEGDRWLVDISSDENIIEDL